ncbi:TIGR01906 family membrane protein [Clostridiaceae bacterium UIB06]|nr:TIGR01906 family membrane protein [Clostridiaceae bacterium UIB06]
MKGMIDISKLFKSLLQILFSISLFLFILTLSIKFTLNFRPLYYFDINYLHIEKYTSLGKNEIKSVYDYLIYYVNTTRPIEFKIPFLPSSVEGMTHFVEVKKLFFKLNFILLFSMLLTASSMYFGFKNKIFLFLKWCSNFTFSICSLLLAAFYWNFDRLFTYFHELLFNNNYWLLDPKTDPVISLLPEEYFLHCAILILLLIVFLNIVIRILYIKLRDDK